MGKPGSGRHGSRKPGSGRHDAAASSERRAKLKQEVSLHLKNIRNAGAESHDKLSSLQRLFQLVEARHFPARGLNKLEYDFIRLSNPREDPHVRAFAIRFLGKIESENVLGSIAYGLKDENEMIVREASVNALSEMILLGNPVLNPEKMSAETDFLVEQALNEITGFLSKDFRELFGDVVKHGDERVHALRENAGRVKRHLEDVKKRYEEKHGRSDAELGRTTLGLGQSKGMSLEAKQLIDRLVEVGERAVPQLVNFLKGKNPENQINAAFGVSRLSEKLSKEKLEPFIDPLKNIAETTRNPKLKGVCLIALASTGSETAVEPILKGISSRNNEVVQRGFEALSDEKLINSLERFTIIEIIGFLKHKKAPESLIELYESKKRTIRRRRR